MANLPRSESQVPEQIEGDALLYTKSTPINLLSFLAHDRQDISILLTHCCFRFPVLHGQIQPELVYC